MVDEFAELGNRRDPFPTVSPRNRHRVRVAAAAVSFVVMVTSGIAWASYRNFSASVPHGSPVPALAAGATDADGADENILLVGSDSRAGATPAELKALRTQNDGGTVNSDTMMVLHVPANGSRPTIVSFPRDSWVDIPGNGKGKINAAYPDGYIAAKNRGASELAAQSAGLIMTIRTINALTGLHIDHYMQVDLLGFYRISNAIGGVTVCLNKAQNPNTDSDAFGKGYSGINLPAGVSVIKGTQALAFVRQRHGLPNGDLDRIRRQQYFLSAAFHKVTTAGVVLNPFKLRSLLNAVGSSLLIDPSLNLVSLAQQFEAISSGQISFMTIPNDGPQVIYPDGVETAIVKVDTAAMPGFVRRLEGKPVDRALQSAIAAAPSSVTVDVLNGTSTAGVAGSNATALKNLGFKVNTVDSTDPTAKTAVEYPAGMQAQAKSVANAVPGAALVETSTVTRTTLVVGNNGVQVRGLTPVTAPTHSAVPHPAAKPTGTPGCIN